MTEEKQALFWAKVDRSNGEAGCWNWTGSGTKNGYGQFAKWHGKSAVAHRVAYELLVGEIPAGLTLDHLCRNTRCCNPAHLEVVTIRENVLRGDTIPARNIAKTHCMHGHELSGRNLYVRPDGRRQCRECKRIWERREYAAVKRLASLMPHTKE